MSRVRLNCTCFTHDYLNSRGIVLWWVSASTVYDFTVVTRILSQYGKILVMCVSVILHDEEEENIDHWSSQRVE